MNWLKYSSVVFGVVFLISGCGAKSATRLKSVQKTHYYVIEKGNKTFYEDFKSMEDLKSFKSIIENTVKSFNEIKNGKRDLEYVNKIASYDLKNCDEHKNFSKLDLAKDELKIINSRITDFQIDGIAYDKDEKTIKIYLYVENEQKQKESEYTLKVYENQTYVFKLENGKLVLLRYSLSEHID